MLAPVLQRAQIKHRAASSEAAKQHSWDNAVSLTIPVQSTLQQQERVNRRAANSRPAEWSRETASSRSWRSSERNVAYDEPPVSSAVALIPVPIREVAQEAEMLLPMPVDVENLADDPSLHNPLQRSERMSTGWFGVVMEYDGVIVEDTSDLQRRAWIIVAELEGKSLPPMFMLRRAEGMKNDQVIKEVFCWTREPMEVRRIAERKEAVLDDILGDMQPMLAPDLPKFMESLASNKVPAVLATSAPEKRVQPALSSLGLENAFEGAVYAEDTYRGRPDPEPYLLAAQKMGRPPPRCVVVGNSNQTVEAAKECGMAAVVVAGRKPLYELKAADLVVKNLGELRVINLQQLFRNEDLVPAQERKPETADSDSEDDDFDSYEDTSLW